MLNILAGLILITIGIFIIFLPPVIEAYKLLFVDWRRIPFVPVFSLLLLSQACITVGLLLIAGVFSLFVSS